MALIQDRSALTIAIADAVDDHLETMSADAFWIRDPVEGEVQYGSDYDTLKWQVLVVRSKFRGLRIRVPFKGTDADKRAIDDRDGVQLFAFILWCQFSAYHSGFYSRRDREGHICADCDADD